MKRIFELTHHKAPSRLAMAGLALACLTACGGEDPPTDCGDSTMSIVTFNGRTSSEEDNIPSCIDIHAASRVDATSSSPGRDESFATSRAGVIPWTDVTFAEAVEACGRAGKFLCDSDELRGIAPIEGWSADGSVRFDETPITALVPTSDVKKVAHRFDALNPYDMVIRGETGKPPFPDTAGSVAYWAASPIRDDKYSDPSIPLVLGRLEADYAIGGYLRTAPVLDADFKHPLLGFRCCVNARMREAFPPLPRDPNRVRKEEPNVPVAER
jgi:hypothetical protein